MEHKIYTTNEIWAIFEEILSKNENVLRRLKEKDCYTVEDFITSRQ